MRRSTWPQEVLPEFSAVRRWPAGGLVLVHPILFIPRIVLDSLHISLGLGGIVLWSALVLGIRTTLERRQ